MLTRGFVLFPLAEIAGDWRDPVANERIEGYIAKLSLADVDEMSWLGRFE